MARYERIVNNLATTLNGAINDSVTSVTVTDGSSYPSEGDFRILVDTEVMQVTARSSNTLTVVRGVDGTTAASHSDAANVNVILTASGLEAFFDNAFGGASSRNPRKLVDSSGNILTASDFTQDTSVSSDSSLTDLADGSIALTSTSTLTSGNGLNVWYKSAPSPPYTVTALIHWGYGFNLLGGSGATLGGIIFRESSTSEFAFHHFHGGDRTDVTFYNGPGTLASSLSGNSEPHTRTLSLWMRMEDDNTDLIWSLSHDGINWFECGSDGRTDIMAGGPDQIGFAISRRGGGAAEGGDHSMVIKSWVEE